MNSKELFSKHYVVAFFSTLVIGAGLLITSFILPPTGKIDPSVLKGVAEIMVWPALAFAAKAIDEGKTFNVKKGDLEIGIEEQKKEE